jgi:hypothetical protein
MKRATQVLIGVPLVLGLMQLVSFDRTNPPVTGEIHAPPAIKALLRRACYDCHSNETTWPWYSRVAPASWLLHRDVVEGRRHLNFSEWSAIPAEKRVRRMKDLVEEVSEGGMPPWFYLPMHAAAHLSAEEKQALESWAQGPVSD